MEFISRTLSREILEAMKSQSFFFIHHLLDDYNRGKWNEKRKVYEKLRACHVASVEGEEKNESDDNFLLD
jgi:hypothetical protein